jgi:hypothetical protein
MADDDFATMWSLPTGFHCVIRPHGTEWHVRVDQDGVTLRERTVPTGETAVSLAYAWENEFSSDGHALQTGTAD